MRLTLYKRGDVWWVYGSEGGVKVRRSTKQTSESLAKRVRDRWERELADPTHHAAHRATVASAAERFMRELRATAKSNGTVRFYDTKVRHVVRLLGSIRLANLTHARVLAYTERRTGAPPLGDGAHQYSVHRELTAIRRILKSAARAREWSGDLKAILPEYATGYVPQTEWRTPEQIWAAIRDLPPNRGAALAYTVATAADFSSIFTAERDDVRRETILVRGTKTTSRKREVPRVSVLEPFIAYALAHGGAKALFAEWSNMARDIRRACVRAGVPGFTARTVRRSVATWMVRAGIAYEIVAKFLGHGSTLMLQKVYGQLAAADAGRLMNERFAVTSAYTSRQESPETADTKETGNTRNRSTEGT